MEKRKNEEQRKMRNVMAALHTYGIEYDTNVIGSRVERRLSDLEQKAETVEYIGDDGGDEFKAKFAEFCGRTHYCGIHGACWADDNKFVVVQLSRLYEMDAQDWKEYAEWCGCEDITEAQASYGDPASSYIYINVRVAKGNIANFVRRYARYCW